MFNAFSTKCTFISWYPCIYQHFEHEKQQKYEQHIREIETGSFTPLVFQHEGVIWVMLLLYFTEGLLSLSLQKELSYSSVMS